MSGIYSVTGLSYEFRPTESIFSNVRKHESALVLKCNKYAFKIRYLSHLIFLQSVLANKVVVAISLQGAS
jgi:hypothetical protein